MAAGGVAGVITSPFQPVDQPSGSERGGDGGLGREGAEGKEKAIKNYGSGNMSRANRHGGKENFTAAGGDK